MIVIIVTLFPLSLARIGVDLYMLPQIEIGLTFFLSIYTGVYPIQLFLYGLLIDVAYGTEIGVTALVLLLINRIICRFKTNLSKQDMRSIILYFASTFVIVDLFKYVIFALNTEVPAAYNLKAVIINLMINIIFYPILHWAMTHSYTKNL